MKADGYLIERCVGLQVGEKCDCESQAYTVHRYRGDWIVLWNNPQDGDLGRVFASDTFLRRFMAGDHSLGMRFTL